MGVYLYPSSNSDRENCFLTSSACTPQDTYKSSARQRFRALKYQNHSQRPNICLVAPKKSRLARLQDGLGHGRGTYQVSPGQPRAMRVDPLLTILACRQQRSSVIRPAVFCPEEVPGEAGEQRKSDRVVR